jgi:GxxExxY protein
MRAQRHHPNEISGALVDAAMKVHSVLGPGLLENVYEVCLVHELNKRGFRTASSAIKSLVST